MTRKLINLLCVFALLFVFPGGASRAAAPAIDEPPQPEGASLASTSSAYILSIPAAALVPQGSNHNYENHGRYLKYFGPEITGRFRAALHLPQGATIHKINFQLHDDSASKNVTVKLYSDELNELTALLLTYTTPGSSGWYQSSSYVTTVINNDNHVYWVEVELPISSNTAGDQVWFGSVNIEYSPPSFTTGRLSITGFAFKPMQDGYEYFAGNSCKLHLSGASGDTSGGYLAQVDLPNGVEVTKLTLWYYDYDADQNTTARLQRGANGSYSTLAEVSSQGKDTGEHEVYTSSIANEIIDNASYAYWVSVDLPESGALAGICLLGVIIDYEFPASNPEHYLSLSAAAFTGFHDGFDYENHARWLFHLAGEGGSTDPQVYLAPVYLPHGAVVDSIYFGFYDGSTTKAGSAYLVAARVGANHEMASVTTATSAGYIWKIVNGDDIQYATIHNELYAYYVYYVLPPSDGAPPSSADVAGVRVRLHYKYISPGYTYLPLVMK